MIEQAFYSALSSAIGVTALVGSNIFPLVLPAAPTLPAIDYNIVASTTDGAFANRGTTKFRFEVNCWGTRYADATSVRAAVIDALDGLRTAIFVSRLATTQDIFEHELLQYRCICEFYVWTNL